MNALDVFAAACPDVAPLDDDERERVAQQVFHDRRTGVTGRPDPADAGPEHRRIRWRVLAVAAAVVVLVAGLAAAIGVRDAEAPGPADVLPPARVPGEPLRLLPADLQGATVVGFVSPPVAASPDARALVLAHPTGDGGYTDKVVVQRAATADIWVDTGGNDADTTVEQVIIGTRTWELARETSDDSYVAQHDLGDGTAIVVSATSTGDTSSTRSAVLATAERVETAGADIVVAPPPPGLEVVRPSSPPPAGSIRYTSFHQTDGTVLTVTTFAEPSDDFAFWLMGALEPLAVRGHDGFVSTGPRAAGIATDVSLAVTWQEAPGHWVIVEAPLGAPQSVVVAFAESLREVTAGEWDAVVTPPGDQEPSATPASTAPTPAAPGTQAPPATTAPQTAPPGTVLVGNAAQIGGLAGEQARALEIQGAEVLEPANASVPGGVALATTRVFARSGAGELAEWVADELGVDLVEPIEALEGFVIDGDVESADVVVVLGLDALTPGLVQDAPLVFGDSVTLGAAGVLSERGYIVNAEVSRQLVDMVPVVADLVDAVDPNIVVIQLGTNGPFGAADLEALLDVVSDVPNVIVVNVHADRSWAATNNVVIAEHDQPGDNVIVMDWDAFADQCPGQCFVSDGVHLTDTGAEFFADRLGDITGS